MRCFDLWFLVKDTHLGLRNLEYGHNVLLVPISPVPIHSFPSTKFYFISKPQPLDTATKQAKGSRDKIKAPADDRILKIPQLPVRADQFSEFTGYKVHMWKSVEFLQTNKTA